MVYEQFVAGIEEQGGPGGVHAPPIFFELWRANKKMCLVPLLPPPNSKQLHGPCIVPYYGWDR